MSAQRHLIEPKFYYEIGPYLSELRRSIESYRKMLAAQLALTEKLRGVEKDMAGATSMFGNVRYESIQHNREELYVEQRKLQAIRDQAEYRMAFCLEKMAAYWPDITFDYENGWMGKPQFIGYSHEYVNTIDACSELKINLKPAFKSIQAEIAKYLPGEEIKK
jgi:hypothetical protein